MIKRGEICRHNKRGVVCVSSEFSTEALALGFSLYVTNMMRDGAIRLELLVFTFELYYQVY